LLICLDIFNENFVYVKSYLSNIWKQCCIAWSEYFLFLLPNNWH
jgi:hypothetical protein